MGVLVLAPGSGTVTGGGSANLRDAKGSWER